MLTEAQGNDLIRELVEDASPAMVARMGKAEMECILHRPSWPEHIRRQSGNNAGIFPTDDAALHAFCETYLACLKHADAMATWLGPAEEALIAAHGSDPARIPLRSLEPYYHADPWTSALEGKTVLVVHPFADTIQCQYRRHRSLFADPRVLPDFDLKVLRAVQSSAGATTQHKNWLTALHHMAEQMARTDFDVAIIGAGAYGLPLACAAKRMGKKGVQMAGATQILFGIKGRRWDGHEVIGKLYNEHWVRPLASETPDGFAGVEGGCYW